MGTPNTIDPWLSAYGEEVPLRRDAVRVVVCRYTPGETSDPFALEALDNVVCVSVSDAIGTDPGTARLRYRFDSYQLDGSAPSDWVEALSDSVAKPKIVEPDDRIVVMAYKPGDGRFVPIFDGFAKSFELALSGDPPRENVSILCTGVASRCFDRPIRGAVVRSAALPGNKAEDRATDVVARCNPKGKGNACPEDAWHDLGAGRTYPTFLDPENPAATTFKLDGTVRYILLTENAEEVFVKNPDMEALSDTLKTKEPKPDKKFDPTDPESFTLKPIVTPDPPLTGKSWPNAVQELITNQGYGMRWALSQAEDASGSPETHLRIFDPQTSPRKALWLQPRGADLDPALTNLGGAELARDLNEVATEWHVEGELDEYEVSFILACAWPTPFDDQPDPITIAFLKTLLKSAPGYTKELHDAFRTWIFDESGEGHYEPGDDVLVTEPGSLDAVLGEPLVIRGENVPVYATRRRPPIAELITRAGGKPLKATLSISKDYEGPCPAVWNGFGGEGVGTGGTWQPVQHGWELLKDRIGIHITAEDPNQWDIGRSDVSGHPFRMGVVRAVECQSNPTTYHPMFFLRLTCKIRGDRRLKGIASHKLDAPVGYPIVRTIDAHDRFKKQTILGGSEHRFDPEIEDLEEDDVARDDTDAAKAEATAIQVATLGGIMGGTVTIPRFTRYYEPGDLITEIQGRGLGFNTKAAGELASPTYPVVIGRQHIFEPDQVTRLQLSDANMARHSYTRRIRRRRDKRNDRAE